MNGTILVLDLGTSYLKTSLFDSSGRLCALHRRPTPVRHPQPGRGEMDPAGFLAALADGIKALLADAARHGYSASEIAAVSFATQANTFVLQDASGQPLTPLILWNDTRASELAPQVKEIAALDGFRGRTGMPLLMIECAPAKLMWLRRHQPEVWNRAARFSFISDYVTGWLTGQHVAEAGAAALSGLVDIRPLDWWPLAVEKAGVPRQWLPRIVRAGTDLGPIVPSVAGELGLPATCRYVVGCLDQYAGAIGTGNVRSGSMSETTGTVLATVRCADHVAPDADPSVFQGPAFAEGLFFHMAFGDTSANLLEAYRNSKQNNPSFDSLVARASHVPPGADGLRVRGLDASGGVAFENELPSHTTGHHVRAILEAVSQALADQVRVVCPDAPPAMIRAAGGAARSDLWLQIKADTLGVAVAASQCPEPTSLGAAILAGAALRWGTVQELADRWAILRRISRPSAMTSELSSEVSS